MEGLEERLQRNTAYFSAMVELIPATHYQVREEEEEQEKTGDEREKKKKGSRFWHNVKGHKQLPTQKAKRRKVESKERATSHDRSGEVEESGVGGARGPRPVSVEEVKSSSLTDLQSRLHQKLLELKGRRRMGGEGDHRHKALKKDKKEERKTKKNDSQKEESKQRRVAVKAGRGGDEIAMPTSRPSGELAFNRFDFNVADTASSKHARKKNLHKLVSCVEANQRKLEETAMQDEIKGAKLKERQTWIKAVEMAGGKKVKDDPKLLKKTMKRLDRRKKMSQKQWEERVRQEEERKSTKQQKRRQNVEERIKLIKAKKEKKKSKKKGRV